MSAPATFASSSSVVVIGRGEQRLERPPQLLADQAVAGEGDGAGHRDEQRHHEEPAEDERLHRALRAEPIDSRQLTRDLAQRLEQLTIAGERVTGHLRADDRHEERQRSGDEADDDDRQQRRPVPRELRDLLAQQREHSSRRDHASPSSPLSSPTSAK